MTSGFVTVGTVIALFFGNVFNLLTRTWHMVDLQEPESEEDKKATDTRSEGTDKQPLLEDAAQ